MQSRNSLLLLLVVALTGLAGFAYWMKPYSLGLDIQGGVRLTYQMDMSTLSKDTKETPATLQSSLKKILEARVGSSLGVVEGNVNAKGDDQLVIELPGFADIEKARETLNTTAKVQVYHAKSVTTRLREGRYSAGRQAGSATNPYYTFGYVGMPGKELSPDDPDTKAQYQKMIDSWTLVLEGQDVADAHPYVNGTNTIPSFRFSPVGAQKMEKFTRAYINQGENIAFVLDGRVLSIAPIQDGQILSEDAQITGKFDAQYVNKLTELIRSGSLPVKLNELSSEQVDPTIGKEALKQMVTAGAIALALTAVYLCIYYAFPGFVATIALALYTLFTLAVLKLTGATFSLAAIAGFILSAAMAVDANILVFERIKEELKAGKKLSSAIELGFRRALSAIFDSNLSTIITSAVLFYFGTGPVRGFATTLIMGVAISFFTAITVTRSLLVGMNSMGWFNNEKYFAVERTWWFEKKFEVPGAKPMDILSKWKLWFGISALAILPGLIAIGANGIKPNVEFQGGFEAQYTLSNDVSAAAIRGNLEKAGYHGANVKFATVGSVKAVYITLPKADQLDMKDSGVKDKLATAAGIQYSKGTVTTVGPTIQKETIEGAIKSVLISALLIVLYLAYRFGTSIGGLKNGLKFGGSAVAALLHDVVFVIGTAAVCGLVFGWEVSALFITAMLTVIGFSVHDTIVIFDRVRENLMKPFAGDSFETVVDKSITQSLARSLNTSLTAIGTLFILILFGTPTPELKFMCTTMMLGIITGTYSSIWNASPILYLWDRAVVKRQGEKASLSAEAQREIKHRQSVQTSRSVEPGQSTPINFGSTPTETPTKGTSQAGNYGQVRRRRSAVEKASHEIDE